MYGRNLRKTPMDGTPLTGPGPTRGQLALLPQPHPIKPWSFQDSNVQYNSVVGSYNEQIIINECLYVGSSGKSYYEILVNYFLLTKTFALV